MSRYICVGLVVCCLCFVQSVGAAEQTGRIVGWGSQVVGNNRGGEFTAVAGGSHHSLGLKEDGSIVAWGENDRGQCDVPSPNANFVAIGAGNWHSVALRVDGSIVAWGGTHWGLCDVPSPNTDFIAIAAGSYHNLGLKEDGSIVAWGENDSGQCDVPSPNNDFIAISAGGYHSLGLKRECQYALPGDLNDDCEVDFDDFALMCGNWLTDCYIEPLDPACVPK